MNQTTVQTSLPPSALLVTEAAGQAAAAVLYAEAIAGRFPAFSWPLPAWPDDVAHFETLGNDKHSSVSHLLDPTDAIRVRLQADRAIVRRALADLIRAGWECLIAYGGGERGEAGWSRDLRALMADIQACDEEWIKVRRPREADEPGHGLQQQYTTGYVYLIYNNGLGSPITDHTTNLEECLKPACDLLDVVDEHILADEQAARRAPR